VTGSPDGGRVVTAREELGWEIARVAELSLRGLLTYPDEPGWREEVTWAGMTCLVYLLQHGYWDPVGLLVLVELEKIKDVWNPEPEWN
jgi:hypothetical protein